MLQNLLTTCLVSFPCRTSPLYLFSLTVSSFICRGNAVLCKLPAFHRSFPSPSSSGSIAHNSNPPQARISTQVCVTWHRPNSQLISYLVPPAMLTFAQFPKFFLVSRPLHVTAKILGLASLPNCMNQFLMTNFLSICILPIGSASLDSSDKYKHLLYIRRYSRHCGFRSGTRHKIPHLHIANNLES